LYENSLKSLLAFGTINNPNKNAIIAIIKAPKRYDLKNLKKDMPELRKAITSVSDANFEVNQITERNKKRGSNELEK
jgi:prolyl-tRNA editing enzyme YbaK/EbsC (Cys-tRNA(Pro) deacylase)